MPIPACAVRVTSFLRAGMSISCSFVKGVTMGQWLQARRIQVSVSAQLSSTLLSPFDNTHTPLGKGRLAVPLVAPGMIMGSVVGGVKCRG